MDEDRGLGRVPQEEDGSVVEYPTPVTLLGTELDSKATRVTSAACRALFTAHGGEASEHLGLLANALEHVANGLGGGVSRID